MNYPVLYQWQEEIATHLTCLNSWQIANTALFTLGVMQAESCQQQQIARAVVTGEQVESCCRRWRRFLANEAFPLKPFFGNWSGWVVTQLKMRKILLLVDETKLQDRIGALVVGVAWEGRCIPLAWRCYIADQKEAYPAEGQVKVIEGLLQHVQAGLPPACEVVVLADRGIGNSSDLCRAIIRLGWYYLFRVTANSKIVSPEASCKIVDLVDRGQCRSVAGTLFCSTGGLAGWAHALWDADHEQPWALVTNDPALSGWEYAQRNWEEQGFRDLKSGGWQWQASRIRQPAHVERLLVILAIAYGWCLALGGVAVQEGKARKPLRRAEGTVRRYWSLFKEGIAFFFEQVQRLGRFFGLCFYPDSRFT